MKASILCASDIKTNTPALAALIARCEGKPRPFLLRLARAVELVELGLVRPCPVVPGDVLIQGSEQEPYRVGPERCDCADSTRRNFVCKHRIARRLFWALEADKARADKVAALASPGASRSAAALVASGAHAAGLREQEARYFAEARPDPVLDDSEAQAPAGDGDLDPWDLDAAPASPPSPRLRPRGRFWLDTREGQGFSFAD